MNTGSKFEANQNTEVELDGTGTEGLDFQKVVLEAQEPAAGAAKAAVADAPEKPDFSGATALTFDDADGNGASADASGLNADATQAALDAAAAADPTVTGGNITIELNQAGDGYELKAGNVVLGSTGNAANNSIVGADNAGTDKALVFTAADGTALGKSENIQAANSRIRDTDMADDGIRQGQRGHTVCTGDAHAGQPAAPERAPAPPVRIAASIFLCLFSQNSRTVKTVRLFPLGNRTNKS